MSRIAVIGSGISGLAAAYYLSRRNPSNHVWLFEKDTRIGGHTHTVQVDTRDGSLPGSLPIDTGFIVHNERTYPNFIHLMQELGVATQASDMSFGVSSKRTGFEYSSRGLHGFFAERANLFRPSHYRLLREITRFNREAPATLAAENASLTLGDYLDREHYDDGFREHYLYPMAGAVWSMSFAAMRAFPLVTLVRFFENHGMLGIDTHPQWRTITGGSNTYIAPITAPYRDRISTGVTITSVVRDESQVTLNFAGRPAQSFDQVVFACHGDQVLPMLDSPTDTERDVLANFKTSRNETVLHTDARLLPRRPAARAAWNYNLDGEAAHPVTLTYHMNRLQSLQAREEYCVTLNANGAIRKEATIRRMVYEHPLYTRPAIAAQSRWSEISGQHRTHYCGAYWFYGFHEDGLNSALRVAQALK